MRRLLIPVALLSVVACGLADAAAAAEPTARNALFQPRAVPVPEEAGLRAFFAPRGGLLVYTAGRSPVLVEIVSSGHFVPAHKRPYGLELITAVPPVATVPGAPLASVRRIKIKVGAAIRKGRRVISYGYMPRRCPRGGFPVRTEIVFGGSYGPGREFGLPAFTAAATYRAPCPRRRR